MNLAERLRAAEPHAGKTRVIAIDGRSGSGKSLLAARLRRELGGVPIVSLEDLYGGWDGLEAGIDRLVTEVLEPLAAWRTALVPSYDWIAERWNEPIPLDPPEFLIVEGMGAGAERAARYLSVLVWLEVPEEERKRRAMARDGEIYRPHWERWAAQEAELLARDDIPGRAG